MRQLTIAAAVVLLLGSVVLASDTDLKAEIAALQQRISQLEAQQSEQSVEERNAELLGQMISELAKQAPAAAQETGMTAGYDDGFFIKSADDQFLLEIDTRLQFRHSYLLTDDGNRDLLANGERAGDGDGVDSSAHGFELERARLYLQGYVMKDLKYNIVLESDDESADGTFLYEYELAYSFMPEFGVKVGRFKAPFSKQETTSSGRQMMVDRSLANEIFNIDRGTGLEVFGQIDLGDIQPVYRAMVLNQLAGNNRTPLVQNDNSLAFAGRLAIPLMGATVQDFKNESDLAWHETPVWQLGGSFAYGNESREDHFVGGESDAYNFLGPAEDGRTDIFELGGEATMFAADVSMKYQGFSATWEGFYQHLDVDGSAVDQEGDFPSRIDPFTLTDYALEGENLDNYGWYAQAGYFLVPHTFELVSRISQVCVEDSNDSWEYAGGWNWYLTQDQSLKLSMDATYIDDLPVVSSSPNYYGVQNNALFLVSTQLQFQF